MSNKGLEEWFLGRTPPVPEPFLPFLLATGIGGTGAPTLANSGLAALRFALDRPGRNREAAFSLLSADALLTYACEEALSEPDMRGWLEELLELIGGSLS
jgi:hypothetical protein